MRVALPTMLTLALAVLTLTAGCSNSSEQAGSGTSAAVDGRIEHGLRVLTFDTEATDQAYTVFRGDYVRPETSDGEPFVLEIPALEVKLAMPAPEGQRPYFKLPDVGRFEFRLGNAAGVIQVIEYAANAYQEVGAREAKLLLDNIEPLVLDVRTPREFAQGHLEGAALIPVQELQARLGELKPYRNQPVFIYCRSGNRSTVAAKLLIDAGHERVINLRRGINEWLGEGLPVVRTPPRDHKSQN